MNMTPIQCRMARAAVGFSIAELGAAAGVRAATVSHFEGGGESYSSTIGKLQVTLEAAGVVFVGDGEASLSGGAGVRLRG
jgi:hypothetical protein